MLASLVHNLTILSMEANPVSCIIYHSQYLDNQFISRIMSKSSMGIITKSAKNHCSLISIRTELQPKDNSHSILSGIPILITESRLSKSNLSMLTNNTEMNQWGALVSNKI